MARFLSALEKDSWPIPMNLIAYERYKLQPGYEEATDVAVTQNGGIVDLGVVPGDADIDEEKMTAEMKAKMMTMTVTTMMMKITMGILGAQ
mmetsp:Transcript_15915/g.24780  ORF Transcript_15915/g.24780 Transcript_15915/m.24780 type:complete len:91 (+) Transcript_15915:764-1036(+)